MKLANTAKLGRKRLKDRKHEKLPKFGRDFAGKWPKSKAENEAG
jgi:hypothetical protein